MVSLLNIEVSFSSSVRIRGTPRGLRHGKPRGGCLWLLERTLRLFWTVGSY